MSKETYITKKYFDKTLDERFKVQSNEMRQFMIDLKKTDKSETLKLEKRVIRLEKAKA